MLVVMLGLSNVMLARVNDGTRMLVTNRIPAIDATARLESENNNIAIALRNIMLTEERGDRQKQAEVVAASRKEIDRILAELDKTLQNPKARQLLAQKIQHADRYEQGQEKLMKLVNEGWTKRRASTWPRSCVRCWWS